MKLYVPVAEVVRLRTIHNTPEFSRIRLPRLAALLLLAFAPLGLLAQEPAPPAAAESPENESRQLTACLLSDASRTEKTLACKRLAIIGDESAVPALATLLRDEPLSHPARIALEAISCEAAGAALREAVPQLSGAPRIGVLNSIGVRRDTAAVPLLRQCLSHEDREVGLAATAALGKIGSPEAAQVLLARLRTADAPFRTAAGNACLECAARLMASGDVALATNLYDDVAAAEVPDRIRLAAARGSILAGHPPDVERLAGLAGADDPQAFRFALRIARELPPGREHPRLVQLLDRLPAERRALWIALLADRGDPAARTAVRECVADEDPQIRTAAIRGLAQLGRAEDVELLVKTARARDAQTVSAARATLIAIEDPGADTAIMACLDANEPAFRLLLEVAGLRRITAAVPILAEAAESSDPDLRRTAIEALGRTVSAEQLPLLTRRVLKPSSQVEEEAARAALRTACARALDKDAAARHVTEALSDASEQQTTFLVDVLGVLGSPVALEAVSRLAADRASSEIQDAATRVLGVWSTADAAPALRELAQTLDDSRFRIRALRGYLRVARQLDVSEQRRLEICQDAFAMAERDEERRLAVETLGRVASLDALQYAVKHLDSANLQEVAADAAVAIGQRLAVKHPDAVAAAMQRVLDTSRNNEIRRRAEALRAAAPAR